MTGKKTKISCQNCGQTNYYPENPGSKAVVCGHCHHPLPRPGEVIEINQVQAANLINKSSLPVLVDFYSNSCGPCMIMAPVVERLAQRRAGELMVVKVDVDRNPELAAQMGITSVPTLVVLHKNVERGRISGAISEMDLALWVARIA
ncbi:MAG: thioredoxin family protein [Acidobacteriota bacterium]|nr:thioredoxin family protein [Acidobacteriota bacterium]MDW3229709.1 thioredoxin family protein [Acidobacteriota bacterium]